MTHPPGAFLAARARSSTSSANTRGGQISIDARKAGLNCRTEQSPTSDQNCRRDRGVDDPLDHTLRSMTSRYLPASKKPDTQRLNGEHDPQRGEPDCFKDLASIFPDPY